MWMHWKIKKWVCLEVRMWVHQKYEMIWIVRKLYSVNSNDCTYLAVHDDGGMIWWDDGTLDLKYTNIKIVMKLRIITDRMSMHCCINM